MSRATPLLQETIKDLYSTSGGFTCLRVADMGCSSGPNTLLAVSNIISTVHGLCQATNFELPEFQVFLNDLPQNDFNTVFDSLPAFYNQLKKRDMLCHCFVAGAPGSFYGRVFPRRSLDFVHSSSSLHWLSQAPQGLKNNKDTIYMSDMVSNEVFQSYKKQFWDDFASFLQSRAEEVVPGGRMVLTFLGRSTPQPSSKDCYVYWQLLAQSLFDLAAQGLIQKDYVESFNMPYYGPYSAEVKEIIENEGSFKVDKLETVEVTWDPLDFDDDNEKKHLVVDKGTPTSGRNVANCVRAALEPMLASQFGSNVMDSLFDKFSEHVDQYLSVEKTKHFNIVISMTRK
ncbi:SAM dependent carboxyl methyltransferase [Dillenia turbinata]|uniref:SAM dependent carboxyl methyltransferase n=1 Tax=Dillenia turbinata TaxID=194707 RepID=A0AAN8UVA8_9MAGN